MSFAADRIYCCPLRYCGFSVKSPSDFINNCEGTERQLLLKSSDATSVKLTCAVTTMNLINWKNQTVLDFEQDCEVGGSSV